MTSASTATTGTDIRDRIHLVAHTARTEAIITSPVVMLHGIGGSVASCEPLASRLAEAGVSSWCVDAPGFGQSADPEAGGDVVDDILDVLDVVSPDQPAVIVGTSWGGVIAMSAVLRRPDRVRALVLADTTRGSGISEQKSAAMRARITELRDNGAVSVAAGRADRLTAPDADPAVAADVRKSMAAVRLPGFSAAAEFMAATDHGPDLPRIAIPALVLVGDKDVITGVDESRLLAERIPNAELHIVDHAGHVAIQEQPAVVAGHVVDFLRRL
ncbi:alpha/beta fold hydrolase [Gordonia sp. DT101]|uniref:alpha/beta fold hydrolase n=1 Tax=Gordonia sp. DT101 TaxID=3416545 RepID=UPI003CF5A93A